jgi:hypothetical protein
MAAQVVKLVTSSVQDTFQWNKYEYLNETYSSNITRWSLFRWNETDNTRVGLLLVFDDKVIDILVNRKSNILNGLGCRAMVDYAKRYAKDHNGRSPFLLTSRIHKLFTVDVEREPQQDKCITAAFGVDEEKRQELLKHGLVGKGPKGVIRPPEEQILPSYSSSTVDIYVDEWERNNIKGA